MSGSVTNNDPGSIDYVIPGNDDAIRAVRLYIHGAASAVLDGRSVLRLCIMNPLTTRADIEETIRRLAASPDS